MANLLKQVAGRRHIMQETADPAGIADKGQYTTKDVAGITEGTYTDSAGVTTQLTGPGAAVAAHLFGGAAHTPDTLANLNSKISDATLDDVSGVRTPSAHLLGGARHTTDTLANLNSKVSDATLIDTGDARLSDARIPLAHLLGGAEHTADTLANLNALISDATLADEADHLKLAGRVGGQTANGGTVGGDELKLRGTAASAAGGFDIASALTIQRALMEPDTDGGRNLGSSGAGNKRYNRLHIIDIEIRKALADAQPVLKLRQDGANGILEAGPGGATVVDIRLIRIAAKKWSIENPAAGVGASLRLGGTGSEGVLEMIDTPDVAASAADQGKIRYNKTTQKFEFSENGVAFAAPGGGTLDDGYDFGGAGAGRIVEVTGGTLPVQFRTATDALPALSGNTAFVVSNAGIGNVIEMSLIGGTGGQAIFNFGNASNEDVFSFDYNSNDGTLTIFSLSTEVLSLNDANGSLVFNQSGSASSDFRMESLNSTNMFFSDGGNDRIVMQKDNGSLPAISADVVLVVSNTSAATDNAVIAIIGGNTSTSSALVFGDTDSATRGFISYAHLTDAFSINANGDLANPHLQITGTAVNLNPNAIDRDFQVSGDSLTHMFFCEGNVASENITFLASAVPSYQGMDRGGFWGDVTTAPSGNPVGGVFVYVTAGAAQVRGGGGTITEWGPSAVHCEVCGSDFWTVASMNMNWKSWCFICGVCDTAYKGGPQNVLDQLTEQQKTEVIRQTSTWEDVKRLKKLVA